jgi:ABC-type Na+ efflux pump permease subunit
MMGRRRYSWEKKGGRRQANNPPAEPLGGLIAVLVLSYMFMRPLFWLFMALIGFVAACFLLIGVIRLGEWIQRRRSMR